MRIKVNFDYLIKGTIFALLIIVGPLIGVFMRLSESNGYTIWGVVASVNAIAFIAVYYLISREMQPEEEKEEKKGKGKEESE